jgi:hypothetical protein
MKKIAGEERGEEMGLTRDNSTISPILITAPPRRAINKKRRCLIKEVPFSNKGFIMCFQIDVTVTDLVL